MVTLKPLACSSLPREAEMIPFPSDEVTPPVTKMYLAVDMMVVTGCKGMILTVINYMKFSRLGFF